MEQYIDIDGGREVRRILALDALISV